MGNCSAAGSGSRFSKTELKQYQYIQNKTVLEHTVSQLNSLDLAGLVLVISEQDEVAPTLTFTAPEKLHFCHGGRRACKFCFKCFNLFISYCS
jgi:2-C-methyl-D-erythritol 4-phosphate cytidylyltransferase